MDQGNFVKQVSGLKGGGDGFRTDLDLDIRNGFDSTGAAVTTTLTSLPGFVFNETNAAVIRWNATIVTPLFFIFNVPGDYDQASDELKLRALIQMSGAADTPAFTVNVFKKTPGSALSADLGPFTMKNTAETANFAGSSTSAIAVTVIRAKALKAGDQLTIKITPAAHGTDTINLYGLTVRYKSGLALYTESER